jgi:hypothetical protein
VANGFPRYMTLPYENPWKAIASGSILLPEGWDFAEVPRNDYSPARYRLRWPPANGGPCWATFRRFARGLLILSACGGSDRVWSAPDSASPWLPADWQSLPGDHRRIMLGTALAVAKSNF